MSKTTSDWIPKNPAFDPGQPMQIGGQAVIEGVMMRAPGAVATAIRRSNGDIVVQKESYTSLVDRWGLKRIPILRGALGLVDMMYVGIRSLNWSAEVAMQDAASREHGGKPSGQTTVALVTTLVIALALGIGIFFVTPLFLASVLFDVEQTAVAFNLVAGIIRILILIGYLSAISLMPDIRRLFQYHGAEHKAVFAFELNDDLTPAAAARYSRFHPRCGTSFLLVVMFVAIIMFALLDALLLEWIGVMSFALRLATHVPFIPVVGGMAYEFIKISARHSATWWGRVAIAPGLWLQGVTTREPDETQLEVAVIALKCALGIEDAGRYEFKDTRVEAAA
ncbi:MAG: membrane protein [Bacteroidia bacterium]|nr:MAG: membrane protein [Bacteroidia bacterium]